MNKKVNADFNALTDQRQASPLNSSAVTIILQLRELRLSIHS